jgi:phospholipid transport system substrate-binding protein
MTTRRFLLLTIPTGLFLGALRPALGARDTAAAADFIKSLGGRLSAISAASGAQRRQMLANLVDQAADVPAVAQFCLGRFWRLATPAQQQEFITLFHQVLINSVAARVNSYAQGGSGITYGTPTEGPNGIEVPTVVQSGNSAPANVVWTVTMASGTPKIIDVQAEGMSMRLTQRNDYAAYLSQHNNDINALLTALKAQAAQNN